MSLAAVLEIAFGHKALLPGNAPYAITPDRTRFRLNPFAAAPPVSVLRVCNRDEPPPHMRARGARAFLVCRSQRPLCPNRTFEPDRILTRNGRQADGLRGLSILVCHLPKSAKQMLIVKLANLEIGSAAERYSTSVAKYFPKPLRALYRGGRTLAVNGFTSSNVAIIEIKRQCHERSDFSHAFPLSAVVSRHPNLSLPVRNEA